MIEAAQLTKRFGGRSAVDGVTLSVARGEVVGFLGPNGAGKTTTLRILAGVFPPDTGAASIDGFDLATAPLAARRRLGYVPERPAVHTELAVESQLAFVAELRDVPRGRVRRDTIERAIARTGLEEVRTRRVGALSRGFRQRVSLATALVGDPPALLLDEPTVGLDPAQSAETRRLVRELGTDHAVFVSSHILGEVETLCDRVVVLHHGRVLAAADPATLAARLRRTTFVDVEAAAPSERLETVLRAVSGVVGVERLVQHGGAGRCRVEVAPERDVRAALVAAVSAAGIDLTALVPVEPSLEEAFLALVGDAPGAPHA